MLKINAFSIASIQTCLHLLNECERAGVTDIRFVRERLATHIADQTVQIKRESIQGRKRMEAAAPKCPDCGARLRKIEADGEKILACPRCRWSKIDEVNDAV